MDGLSDNSPFITVISIVDLIDKLQDARQLLLPLLCPLSVLYVFGGWMDLILILICAAWNCRFYLASWIYASDDLKIGLASILAVLTIETSLRRFEPWSTNTNTNRGEDCGPYVIPCRTTHTRNFPKKHSFSYPYFVVGIPVGFKGNLNGMISVDDSKAIKPWLRWAWPTGAWLDVDSADYLQRGHTSLGLRGKLDNYLESRGINPADYPHAFLVTAARFLGYHFNPFSFWYLYSPDKILSAMVLEINNTFGERHAYLILRDFVKEARRIPAQETPGDGLSVARVKASWQKQFFVSPFSSRKGSYSLLASDPLGDNMEGFRGIDITINLVSSKERQKLAVRLFSNGEAINPSKMAVLERVNFVLSWFWVGFFTFPRMMKEAAVLFLRHELHFWYRPEPLKDSFGRLANSTERQLEVVFRTYLQFLVEQSPNPLVVRYVPSGITDVVDMTFRSPASQNLPGAGEHVEVKILTPVFYARFVHYAHDFEAIFTEFAESCTVWVDRPEVLPKIFLKKKPPPLHAPSLMDFLYFKLIQRLRRRPNKIVRPMTSAASIVSSTTHVIDIRDFRISAMDAFVLERCDIQQRVSYRSAVARLFVADRFFFGIAELLYAIELLLRTGVAWWLVSLLSPR